MTPRRVAALLRQIREYPHITAEFHSGDREPGTFAEGVPRVTVDRWADELEAALADPEDAARQADSLTVADLRMIASVLTDHADQRADDEDQPDGQHDAAVCRAIARKAGMAAARPAASAVPSELEIAERIAREAHTGQKDTVTGDDYIHHIERVVALVEGDEAKAVAWLHDVLEDNPDWTRGRLVDAGISRPAVAAVALLTRDSGDSYRDYIDAIIQSGDALAHAVKVADLQDHLRPNCPERLRPRYLAALTAFEPSSYSRRRGGGRRP